MVVSITKRFPNGNYSIFLIVGSAAILMAWLTVGTHACKVTRTNPNHALRTE